MEVAKIRAARDEGKRAWLYKGKAVIAQFGDFSNAEQQRVNKNLAESSSIGNYVTRSALMARDKNPISNLLYQNK